MSTHQFQLVGGDVVLDFLNTISDWTVPEPREHIPTFAEALRFAEAAGLITRAEARRLGARPTETELRRLVELRARLERILRAVLTRRAPSSDDLDALSREAADGARMVRLKRNGERLVRTIEAQTAGIATLRWRLVEAAVALLTSERLARLRACPRCGWFFLDASKNRSRRWCSMAMCGSAAKARSYYWRMKRRSKRGTT